MYASSGKHFFQHLVGTDIAEGSRMQSKVDQDFFQQVPSHFITGPYFRYPFKGQAVERNEQKRVFLFQVIRVHGNGRPELAFLQIKVTVPAAGLRMRRKPEEPGQFQQERQVKVYTGLAAFVKPANRVVNKFKQMLIRRLLPDALIQYLIQEDRHRAFDHVIWNGPEHRRGTGFLEPLQVGARLVIHHHIYQVQRLQHIHADLCLRFPHAIDQVRLDAELFSKDLHDHTGVAVERSLEYDSPGFM